VGGYFFGTKLIVMSNQDEEHKRKQPKLDDSEKEADVTVFDGFKASPFGNLVGSTSGFASVSGDVFGASPFSALAQGASPFAQVANSNVNAFEKKEDEEETTEDSAVFSGVQEHEVVETETVLTGEEDEECIFHVRAKLYRLSEVEIVSLTPEADSLSGVDVTVTESTGDEINKEPAKPKDTNEGDTTNEEENESVKENGPKKEYRELGVGIIRINVPKKGSSGNLPRMVMRREGVLKLLLNASIWKAMPLEKASEKVLRFSCISLVDTEDHLDTFLLKLSRATECTSLLDSIKKARDYE